MKNHTELVREFMLAFGQHAPERQEMADASTLAFRRDLIAEEADELLNAADLRDALDAIADLLYVVHGAAVTLGFSPETVDAAFAEVHRSNMSKAWTLKEVEQGEMQDCAFYIGRDLYAVFRHDGKIIKSPSYSPANLVELVEDAE